MDESIIVAAVLAAAAVSIAGISVIGYSIRKGAEHIAKATQDCLKTVPTQAALNQAADKYMLSLKKDMAAVASRQERQEQVYMEMLGQFIVHFKLVPVLEMGNIVGFRKAKKGEVFDSTVPNWHDTQREINLDPPPPCPKK